MTDQQILRSIRTLVREECANYRYGYCLETDDRCHVINPDYDTIHDGTLDCDYFLDCVLPADWTLNDLVAYALWYDEDGEDDDLPRGMKRCEMCRQPFTIANKMMNSTMKIVRGKVEKHYADRIEYALTPEGKNLLNDKNIASL